MICLRLCFVCNSALYHSHKPIIISYPQYFSQLKIRVIEYDAGGFKNTENTRHQEYQVSDIRIHDQYDSDRLTYDLAVLKVETRSDGFGGVRGRIDLTSTDDINAACLPGCDNMFDYQFNNGTGVR